MSNPKPIRLLLALALLLGLMLSVLFLFIITDYAYSVWNHLQQGPRWFAALYIGVGSLTLLLALWFILRVLFPKTPIANPQAEEIITETDLTQQLEVNATKGIDTSQAEHELKELHQRRSTGDIYIALLGEINTGKSSLIKALLPDIKIHISPQGGATQDTTQYEWVSPAGDKLILTDLPGLNEVSGTQSQQAREEAIRAHIVIYVCDGDLTADQFSEVTALQSLKKPFIVALNKIDQLNAEQQLLLTQRLQERLLEPTEKHPIKVVTVSSGGQEEVTRLLPNGVEQTLLRNRKVEITPLSQAIQKTLDEDESTLEQLRDASVFVLAKTKLDSQIDAHRKSRSNDIVESYTRKAIIGAVAAVAPGTDVLIQGYLGINLVKDLCELHDVPTKEIDINRYLALVGKNTGKTLPLILAITGNALKAFPGLGTLSGGALHAIAYGLIFDSLGRAVVSTLESRGCLRAAPTARQFEQRLSENLVSRSTTLVNILLEERNKTAKRHHE